MSLFIMDQPFLIPGDRSLGMEHSIIDISLCPSHEIFFGYKGPRIEDSFEVRREGDGLSNDQR